MPTKSFSNELNRALARPDVTRLLGDLDDYFLSFDHTPGERAYPRADGGNYLYVMDADRDDPDKGIAYLALAMHSYDDCMFLGVLAAGLLEDLLRDPTQEILNRIIAEARKTPRFRWMLSGVWLHAIAERARHPVERAVGGWRLEDQLPPPPF